MLRVAVVLIGLVLSLPLFRKAAGTLHIGKINLISYTMYLFLLQTYVGASLVYLGDRNHYTMNYIMNDSSFDTMFYAVLLTAIVFPLSICALYAGMNVNIRVRYQEYLV